jgi:DNA-binding beta-propeller fold protein YncE
MVNPFDSVLRTIFSQRGFRQNYTHRDAFDTWEAGGMKLRCMASGVALAAVLLSFVLGGCGSSSTANVITVAVTSSAGPVLILGQSTTLNATVTGATNTMVNWQPCQFTTTTVSGTTPTTTAATSCPTDGSLGTLSNQEATGTATFVAPSKVPDQTKYPNLQIVLTAQSQSDTKKTGSVNITLDSGIGASLTPTTATVPTNELQHFNAVLTNDLQSQGVTWSVTQSTPTAATATAAAVNYPDLPTCSPTCGTIASSGLDGAIYTAPATVPTVVTPSTATGTTPPNVTVVGTAKADNTRFVIATVTIIAGGPITLNGVSPSIAPQGAALWDIYLDAPNISSASSIILTDQTGAGHKTFTSDSGQVKVLFPIPTSTTPAPPSTGARLRLLEGDLPSTVSTYTVSVTDPGEPVTQTAGGNFTINVVPVRPTVLSTIPQSLVPGINQDPFPVTIDGGYFGPGGTVASVLFQGNQVLQGTTSNSRKLSANIPASAVGVPGLYPLLVSRTSAPLPVPNNPAVSTIAVFPDYSTAPPTVGSSVTTGTNPSAIDIDPQLGVVVVALTGANAIQFYSIAPGNLTPLGGPVAVGQIPTGLSVNRTNHSVAVVNYGSQSVSIVPIPGAPSPVAAATVDISGALQGQAGPLPLPYAIGVDPDTNLALVAYSSSSISSAANVGFVVNLNQGAGAPYGCLGGTGTPPCLYSQVTLNTGQYPQIAMAPHGHLAYVTPGGSGVLRGVDVTSPSTSVAISSLTLTSGVVTVTATGTLTGIVPGIPTTVLVAGVPTTNSAGNTNFNGVFSINSTSSNTFSYALNTTASGTASGGTVFYGSPNLNFGGIPPTTQGIAINPITHSAALVNPNATGGQSNTPQINVLNQLDQSVTSIILSATCTAFSPTCANGTESTGTASVAWQPYANSIISYNPGLLGSGAPNLVSVSAPVTAKRYAIIDLGQTTTGSFSLPVQNGTTGTLLLSGGVAVDPATNQAFVVESGSNMIRVINLGPSSANTLKKTEITEIIVPNPSPGPGIVGGIPKALLPQGTLTSTTDLAGVQIFGAGFTAGAQVRLDGTPLPAGNVNIDSSGRLITATIPAVPFLAMPHHYALDVLSGGVQSNATDFIVIKAVDMSVACTSGPATPSSVAIADQLANGPFSPIAVVTNSGCNNISIVDINTASPTFGHVLHSIAVGTTPQGIAVSPRLGLAVIANNGGGTASVVNLLTNTQPVAAVSVGTNPIGVAISDSTGVALVANFTSNTVSEINLGLLFGSAPATSLTATTIGGVQQPIAVAIDPDRGSNHQGLAVVTGLQLNSSSGATGALYPVDIGLASPALSTTISAPNVSSSPTGIVFNPAVATGTANLGLFYVNASGADTISSYNPDTGSLGNTSVGINPTALAVNPQSGALLTSNFAGKSASVVDTTSGARTVQTLGLPGSAQFGVAIDQFTNLAVVVDQANNRVLLFPMPN